MPAVKVEPKKLKWLQSTELKVGSHKSVEEGVCVMEAVAFVAGEPHTDFPKCASRVISRFCLRLNDRCGDKDRQTLRPYVLRIVGTASGIKDERKRAYLCADWAIRELTPIWLDSAKLPDLAAKLRSLPEVIDPATAESARKVTQEARAAAKALWQKNADAYAATRAKANASALTLLDKLIAVHPGPFDSGVAQRKTKTVRV